MNYFVTGIDTDSGKTLASAILCEALNRDYWKPIQAGLPKDSDTIKDLSPKTRVHPESYFLNTPASPHASAKIDGVEIRLSSILLPENAKDLIIEGAGGCLVPINDHDFIVDLIPQLNATVILVADLYLGSINHTLLTLKFLQSRNYPLLGIIFNGNPNPESERIILHHASCPCVLRINKENNITQATVKRYASILKTNWNEKFNIH